MQILAIYIDRPQIRSALLEMTRFGPQIRTLHTQNLNEQDAVKEFYKKRREQCISALPVKDVLIRSFELKNAPARYLSKALAHQAESATQLNSKEFLSVPFFRKAKERQAEASLFLANREAIANHLKEIGSIGLDPDCLSTAASALLHYAQWKVTDLKNAFIIDLGLNEWSCIYIESSTVKKAHSLNGGLESLLQAFWEDRKKILLKKEVEGAAKQVDLFQLRPHLNPHFYRTLLKLKQELIQAIFSFTRETKQTPVFFTGHVDAFIHLREYLLQGVQELAAVDRALTAPPEELKFAIPIGLGLEYKHKKKDAVQLRREEFFPAKYWKKIGIYSLALLLLSISGSCGILYFGQQRVEEKRSEIADLVKQYLSQKNPRMHEVISGNDLEHQLNQWNSLIHTGLETAHFPLTVPKVSELLSWLSIHPLLLAFEESGSPLNVRKVRYRLVRYPNISTPRDSYETKVEIEFETKSSLHARKFHESLLRGEGLIDPKKEIGWEVLGNGYKTTFFLKQRGSHV